MLRSATYLAGFGPPPRAVIVRDGETS